MNTPAVTIRHRTNPAGQAGWEAVTIAPIVTTHTIGLHATALECKAVVERMMEVGMMKRRPIVINPHMPVGV
jgi:hypothetical protein